MIDVSDLTKRYGRHLALDRVGFQVAAGEIVGLLGPNGAGKTTTMRILTCYLPATSGRVTIGGRDVLTDPVGVRRLIGYLPESTPLYGELRVREYLAFRARIKGVPRRERAAVIDQVAERCRIEPDRLGQRIDTLSKGYRQRVGLADALLHTPPVLILDEPTAGLDPNQIIQVRQLIRELGRERTVILSTHILPEVEAICDRVLIMNRGRIVPREKIDRMLSRRGVILEVRAEASRIQAALEGVSGVKAVTKTGEADGISRFELETEATAEEVAVREAVFRACALADAPILEMRTRQASLEQVFVKITAGQLSADPPTDAGAGVED